MSSNAAKWKDSEANQYIFSIQHNTQVRKFVFGRLFLCCNNASWKWILHRWKPVYPPFKWRHTCQKHAFVGWAAELSVWVAPMKNVTNLCQVMLCDNASWIYFQRALLQQRNDQPKHKFPYFLCYVYNPEQQLRSNNRGLRSRTVTSDSVWECYFCPKQFKPLFMPDIFF